MLIRGVLRGAAIEVAANGMPVASSVAQEGSQLGQTVTQPFIQTRPTIIVHEGEPVNIQPISGVTLPPYREPSHAIQ